MGDAKPGTNYPPMHPRCRSTTIEALSPELMKKLERRARDPETGELRTVPGDMTYREWYEKYVEGGELTGEAESGIISEKEQLPRKVKDSETAVDWPKIQTPEYSDKFRKISSDERVSSAIETRAKWALNNCDGSAFEELYAISLNSGDEIGRITGQHIEYKIKRTKKFNQQLAEAEQKGDSIILIHNHPRGLPPSVDDINALLDSTNAIGITAGYNGSVYLYTRPETPVNEIDYNVKLRHYKNLDQIESMELALEELQEKFGFTITKL